MVRIPQLFHTSANGSERGSLHLPLAAANPLPSAELTQTALASLAAGLADSLRELQTLQPGQLVTCLRR